MTDTVAILIASAVLFATGKKLWGGLLLGLLVVAWAFAYAFLLGVAEHVAR